MLNDEILKKATATTLLFPFHSSPPQSYKIFLQKENQEELEGRAATEDTASIRREDGAEKIRVC